MINLRKASVYDIEQIVVIHCDAFADFFLTELGPTFLSFYYSCFIRSNEGMVLCAEENGKVIGFSATAKRCRGFNLSMIKNNINHFMWISIVLLFSNPKALFRLVRNLTKTNGHVIDTEDYAELYSIAVKKGEQGKGIGRKLLLETENRLKVNNIRQISLTTDCFNNEATIAFYKSMKYDIFYEFITYPQRKMYRLIKKI